MLFLGMPIGREGRLSQGDRQPQGDSAEPASLSPPSPLPPPLGGQQGSSSNSCFFLRPKGITRIPPSARPGHVEDYRPLQAKELEGEQTPSRSVSILRSRITSHHILKVMLTFLSQEAKPKTTQAQLVLARVQIQGLSQ